MFFPLSSLDWSFLTNLLGSFALLSVFERFEFFTKRLADLDFHCYKIL